MKLYPLAKQHRLYRRSEIEALFAGGKSFTIWPIKCTFIFAPTRAIMVSAPKKLFRHAVDRNRLKRLLRESYRLNQASVDGLSVHISLSYIGRTKSPFSVIENATKEILIKIREKSGSDTI